MGTAGGGDVTLQALARMALPLALLCIGAALWSVPVRGNRRLPLLTTVHKVVLSPLIGYALGHLLGLDEGGDAGGVDLPGLAHRGHILYDGKADGGDEGLAASAVVYSAVASGVALAVVIAGFSG
ncbi:MAG: hypothetical protein J6386_04680 [Candidatus Synoicihabitans palmerolidicus]|nr:hypothetical protein [Candidatus Synoicihabitans palmerolidicus]MCC5022128.1 hypothetical protein [Candidatus Synoicihabitans palmerolidicus]